MFWRRPRRSCCKCAMSCWPREPLWPSTGEFCLTLRKPLSLRCAHLLACFSCAYVHSLQRGPAGSTGRERGGPVQAAGVSGPERGGPRSARRQPGPSGRGQGGRQAGAGRAAGCAAVAAGVAGPAAAGGGRGQGQARGRAHRDPVRARGGARGLGPGARGCQQEERRAHPGLQEGYAALRAVTAWWLLALNPSPCCVTGIAAQQDAGALIEDLENDNSQVWLPACSQAGVGAGCSHPPLCLLFQLTEERNQLVQRIKEFEAQTAGLTAQVAQVTAVRRTGSFSCLGLCFGVCVHPRSTCRFSLCAIRPWSTTPWLPKASRRSCRAA